MDHVVLPSHPMHPTVLSGDGWLQWVQETSGLRAVRVSYAQQGKSLPRLDGVLYVDKKGVVRNPPLNPYLPFVFSATNTTKLDKLSSQWIAVSSLFAEDLAGRGLAGSISLPPAMVDGRSFQWSGFDLGVRYTPVGPLPLDPSVIDNSVRKRISKAAGAGYVAQRSDDWVSIMRCLEETETAKKFSHRLDARSLRLGAALIGDDAFRGYVVRDPQGLVVSGGVRLHTANGVAVDWVQGSLRSHLPFGVNQLIYAFVFEDLTAAGATAFNYAGANIPSVASAKASWGLPVVPYLSVGATDVRFMVNAVRSSLRSFRSR